MILGTPKCIRALTLITLLLVASGLTAQQQTAEVVGTVADTSGAVVDGAAVSVINQARGIKMVVTTDAQGHYVAPLLPPAADYRIEVSKPGFNQVVRTGVTLQVAQVAQVNITLTVGAVSQSVSVTGAPPLLDTQTSSIGQVISERTVVNLPLNGRSSFRLIQLTPGVTFSQAAYGQFGDVPVNTTWETQFAVNGGRSGGNAILIDGVPATTGFQNEITTIPSIDDTQEFKVQSDNLSAEYGRYSGGVVNVATKSGTQQLRGTAFEFLRNSVLNADDYIDNQHGVKVPPFKMSQFGFAVGGPVVLPKINSRRDKMFFFGDLQETRRNQGTTFVGTVPTALQRTGDFSQTLNSSGKLVTIYNPFSTRPNPTNPAQYIRDPFPGNVIPQNLLDPVAQKIIAYYPLPNTTGSPNTNAKNYINNAPLIVDQNAGSARIDQNVNQMYHFFGRFGWSLTSLDQPSTFGNIASGGAGQVGPTVFHNWTFAFDNTIVLSPTLLVTIDYGYARWFQSKRTLSYGFDNSALGFPDSLVSQIAIPTFPATTVPGYSPMSGQTYLLNGNDAHNLLSSLTKIYGRQTVVVGTDVRLHLINRFSVVNPGGTYAFAIAQTQGPNPNAASATAGNALASLLLGAGNSGSMPIGAGVELSDWYLAGYVQDDVRLSNKLTANLGVRYETESPYTDRHNGLNYFDPTVASPAANNQFPSLTGGLVFAGVSGQADNVYRWNKNQFSPRMGFAYTPISNTVVRGGFGMVFAPLEITDNAAGTWPNTGFSSSTGWTTSVNGGLTPANLLSNPFPNGLVAPTGSSMGTGTALGQSITVWDPTPKTPESYQWNFGLQRQLPSNILVDAAYVANRGLHLTSDFNLNQLDPSYLPLGPALQSQVANPFQPYVGIGPLSKPTVARMQLLLPFPQFTGVKEMNATWGGSNYQAFQLKFEKRETHGVTFLAAYTISKWLSDVSDQQDKIGPNDSPGTQNYYDLKAEKSLSEDDIPQSLILNSIVQLPFGPGRAILGRTHGLLARLVEGWSASGILTEQSGLPLVFTAPIVLGGNRPNYVQGVSPKLSSSRSTAAKVAEWFNKDAFALPAAFTFGNVPRTVGTVRGPAMHNVDFAFLKNTKLMERLNMEFQAQAFNLTNTPHFDLPATNLSTPTFGQITATLASPPAREIQFAIKLNF